ncbi:MAG: DUF559 domain-containing protein [candidate division WOR-3 bacterium]
MKNKAASKDKIIIKRLRRKMTEAEKKIWDRVRDKQLGIESGRQQPIGDWVVDSVGFEKKLVIEIDGRRTF